MALTWGTAEIVFLGARAQVLSLVGTLLLAPGAMELDILRRKTKAEDKAE